MVEVDWTSRNSVLIRLNIIFTKILIVCLMTKYWSEAILDTVSILY